VAWSADGKVVATGGVRPAPGAYVAGAVRVWDAATGAERPGPRGPLGGVSGLALTPDGKRLVTAEWVSAGSARLRLWDAATGEEVAVLATAEGREFTAVAQAPDGQTLAAGDSAGNVRLFDLATRREREPLEVPGASVTCLAFAPDGRALAAGYGMRREYTVRLWDVAGRRAAVLRGHTADVWGVAYSPDGKSLVSCSGDRTVRLWDPATGQERAALDGFPSPVTAVAFAPDSRTLAAAGYNWVRLWHAATDAEVPTAP
jgi:WD40 repeat protein